MADEEQLGSEQRGLMETGLPGVHRFLVQHYDLDELHTLCFDLGANYDDLAGTTLSSKARELVLWAGRQRKLEQLLAALRDARRTPFEQAGLSLEPSDVGGAVRRPGRLREQHRAPVRVDPLPQASLGLLSHAGPRRHHGARAPGIRPRQHRGRHGRRSAATASVGPAATPTPRRLLLLAEG